MIAAVLIGALGALAPADLRITEYTTIKPPETVRACVVQALDTDAKTRHAPAPVVTPLTTSPKNDGWTISFVHQGQPASVIVLAFGSTGSRILYPAQIAISDKALGQQVEDCG